MADGPKIVVNIQDLRKPYHNEAEPYLFEASMADEPMAQFDRWFKNLAARPLKYEEINAVALSTVSDNKPSSRMVLLKEYSDDGFAFYTNAVSRKATEFTKNPNAALLFYWPIVDRQTITMKNLQVRVEGQIEQLDAKLADEYWLRRPLSSRIGSKLSPQSSVIPSRQMLDEKQAELEKLAAKSGESAISRPEAWLGYILRPNYFEFWQGQSNRIHDRLIYKRANDNNAKKWVLQRLAP